MGTRHSSDSELDIVIRKILTFRDERDWGQFHTAHSLAAAVAIEAAELQELLLWKTDDEAAKLLASGKGLLEAQRELADILIYALLFCSKLGIDPIQAIRGKLVENERKYPVLAAKGNATKYTKLSGNRKSADKPDQYALDLFLTSPPSPQDSDSNSPHTDLN
jgi:NTP pyrophosphatase (non-canonical NTP hydrolase)